jgi:hypothetical protein
VAWDGIQATAAFAEKLAELRDEYPGDAYVRACWATSASVAGASASHRPGKLHDWSKTPILPIGFVSVLGRLTILAVDM